jgi:hypothetical protein
MPEWPPPALAIGLTKIRPYENNRSIGKMGESDSPSQHFVRIIFRFTFHLLVNKYAFCYAVHLLPFQARKKPGHAAGLFIAVLRHQRAIDPCAGGGNACYQVAFNVTPENAA